MPGSQARRWAVSALPPLSWGSCERRTMPLRLHIRIKSTSSHAHPPCSEPHPEQKRYRPHISAPLLQWQEVEGDSGQKARAGDVALGLKTIVPADTGRRNEIRRLPQDDCVALTEHHG